jgi:hypothetical protein
MGAVVQASCSCCWLSVPWTCCAVCGCPACHWACVAAVVRPAPSSGIVDKARYGNLKLPCRTVFAGDKGRARAWAWAVLHMSCVYTICVDICCAGFHCSTRRPVVWRKPTCRIITKVYLCVMQPSMLAPIVVEAACQCGHKAAASR